MQIEAKAQLLPEPSHYLKRDVALGGKGQRVFCVTPTTFLLTNLWDILTLELSLALILDGLPTELLGS